MTIERTTQQPAATVAERIEAAAKSHGFGVLHSYDFRQTLQEKGHPIDFECRVLELCSPAIARQVLNHDASLAAALPCRIAVFEQDGGTRVSMIGPVELLALVSNDADIRPHAQDVEQALTRLMDEVTAGK
ncbi:DUF302 domain-containing protein [Lysobacter sp. A3-1-A15]|uniref:DUF302 domain-containing protein n=1 Tax=Novilysobacter viscosus TaxID=3098602 RepID=UPI002ED81A8F